MDDDESNLNESRSSSISNDSNNSTSEPYLQDASRHRKTSPRVKPFICPYGQCGTRAFTAEGLRGHMDVCPHKICEQNINSSNMPSSVLQCNLCPKTFKSERGLNGHLGRHERDKTNPKGMARFVCRICRVTYYDSLYVRLRPYSCPHCPYRYAVLSSMTKHLYDHHTDRADGSSRRNRLRTPYYCDECPRRFFLRKKLREHVAVIHAKSNRYGANSRSQTEDSEEHDHDYDPTPSTSHNERTRRRQYSSSSSSSSYSSEDEEPRKKKSLFCKFPRCNKVYTSEYFFKLHQRTKNHNTISSSEESADETATSPTRAKRRRIYYDPSIILTPCSVVLRRLEDVSVVYESDQEDEEDARDPLAVHSENVMDDDVPVEVEVEVGNNGIQQQSDEVEIYADFNNQLVQPQSGEDVGMSARSSGYATHGSRDMEDLDDEEGSPDFSLSFPDESEEPETDDPPVSEDVRIIGYARLEDSESSESSGSFGDLEENPGLPLRASSPLPSQNSSSDTEENEGPLDTL